MKTIIIFLIIFISVVNVTADASFFNESSVSPQIKSVEFGVAISNSKIVKVNIEGDTQKETQLSFFYKISSWPDWHESVDFQRYAYDTINTKQETVLSENQFLGRIFNLRQGSNYEARIVLELDNEVIADTLIEFYTNSVERNNYYQYYNEYLVSSDRELEDAVKNIRNLETIVLAPGVYNSSFILNNLTSSDSKLIIKAFEFGTVFIEPDGNVNQPVFSINSSSNLRFESLIFSDVNSAFNIKNSNSIEIFNCVFENVENPIVADHSENIFINNSHFEYNGQDRMFNESVAISLQNSSLSSVLFSSFYGFSSAVEVESFNGSENDFYISNNDFNNIETVAISIDNISSSGVIKSNRFTNGALAIKLSDIAKGPLYIFRNVVFNFKNGIDIYGYSKGIEMYHNNFFTTSDVVSGDAKWSDSKFINNVFLPTTGYSFYSGSFSNGSVISNNAIDLNNHNFVKWSFNKGATYTEFRNPRDVFFVTGYFDNSFNASYNEFNNIPFPNASRQYDGNNLDWYPLRRSILVDKAMYISGINADFYNSAPDIGAQEYGDSLEVFGPLPLERIIKAISDETDSAIEDISVFPNPFNSSTSLDFRLNRSTQLSVGIYDITGRLVKEVYKGDANFGNINSVISFDNVRVSSGIYFIKIQAGGNVHKERICYIK